MVNLVAVVTAHSDGKLLFVVKKINKYKKEKKKDNFMHIIARHY